MKKKNISLDQKLNDKNKEFRDFVLKKSESTLLHSNHENQNNDIKDQSTGRFSQLRSTLNLNLGGRASEQQGRTFKPRKGSLKKSFRSSFTLKRNL